MVLSSGVVSGGDESFAGVEQREVKLSCLLSRTSLQNSNGVYVRRESWVSYPSAKKLVGCETNEIAHKTARGNSAFRGDKRVQTYRR